MPLNTAIRKRTWDAYQAERLDEDTADFTNPYQESLDRLESERTARDAERQSREAERESNAQWEAAMAPDAPPPPNPYAEALSRQERASFEQQLNKPAPNPFQAALDRLTSGAGALSQRATAGLNQASDTAAGWLNQGGDALSTAARSVLGAGAPPPQTMGGASATRLDAPTYTPPPSEPEPEPEPESTIRSTAMSPRPAAAPMPMGTELGEPSPPEPWKPVQAATTFLSEQSAATDEYQRAHGMRAAAEDWQRRGQTPEGQAELATAVKQVEDTGGRIAGRAKGEAGTAFGAAGAGLERGDTGAVVGGVLGGIGQGAVGAFGAPGAYVSEAAQMQGYGKAPAELMGAAANFMTPWGGASTLANLAAMGARGQKAISLLGAAGAATGGGLAYWQAKEAGKSDEDAWLAAATGAVNAADLALGVGEGGRAVGLAAPKVVEGVRRLGGALPRAVEAASGDGAVSGVVPAAVARTLPGEVRLPATAGGPARLPLAEVVNNTPGAALTDDGLEMDLSRWQRAEQAGALTNRTGVLYTAGVVDESPYGPASGLRNSYGNVAGDQAIAGRTLFKRPLVVDEMYVSQAYRHLAGTSRAGPLQIALEDVIYAADSDDVAKIAVPALAGVLRRYGVPDADALAATITRTAPNAFEAGQAAQEAVIATAARRRGYDGIIAAGDGRIQEVFDLREATYPTPEGGYSLRPEFQPKTRVGQEIAERRPSSPAQRRAGGQLPLEAESGAAQPEGYSPVEVRPPAPEVAQEATDSSLGISSGSDTGTRRVYHGTGTTFDRPDAAKFDPNGLYGPGYYLTDEPRVAGAGDVAKPGYAEAGLSGVMGQVRRLEREIEESRPYVESFRSGPLQKVFPDATERAAQTERDIAALEAKRDALLASFAPQIRPVDLPEGLNLFDVDAPFDRASLTTVRAALTPVQRERFDRFMRGNGPQTGITQDGALLYQNLREAIAAPTGADARASLQSNVKAANDLLSAAGYDGIRYDGGKNMPLTDDAGKAIAHSAYAIFPKSLPKLRNALSGQPGGVVAAPGLDTSFPALLRGTAGNPSAQDVAAGQLGMASGAAAGTSQIEAEDDFRTRAGKVLTGAALGGLAGPAALRLAKGGVAVARELGESGITAGRSSGADWQRTVAAQVRQADALGTQAARVRATLDTRFAAWEESQEALSRLETALETAKAEANVVRPEWAHSPVGNRAWTREDLEAIAARSDLPPGTIYQANWGDQVDPETIRLYQREVVNRRTGTAQGVGSRTPTQERLQQRQLQKEVIAARNAAARVDREVNRSLSQLTGLETRYEALGEAALAAATEGGEAPTTARILEAIDQLRTARRTVEDARIARGAGARRRDPLNLGFPPRQPEPLVQPVRLAADAEPSLPLSPPADDRQRAANLLLEKYALPEPVKVFMQDLARAADSFAVQRRGIIPDAQAVQNAMGVKLSDLVADAPAGTALNQEQTLALKMALGKQASPVFAEFAELQARMLAGEVVSPEEKARAAEHLTELTRLMQVLSGATAEWGRTGRALRADVAGSSDADLLRRIVERLGGAQLGDELAEELLRVDLSDPQAMAAFLNEAIARARLIPGQQRLPTKGQMPFDLPQMEGAGAQMGLPTKSGVPDAISSVGERTAISRTADLARRRQILDAHFARTGRMATSEEVAAALAEQGYAPTSPIARGAVPIGPQTQGALPGEAFMGGVTEAGQRALPAEVAEHITSLEDLAADRRVSDAARIAAFREAFFQRVGSALTDPAAAQAERTALGYRDVPVGVEAVGSADLPTNTVQTAIPGLTPPSGRQLTKDEAKALVTARDKAIVQASKQFASDPLKLYSWVNAYDALRADDLVGREKLLAQADPATKREQFIAFTVSNMFGLKTVVTNAVGGIWETGTRLGEEAFTPGYGPAAAAVDALAMWRARGQALGNGMTALVEGVRPSRGGEQAGTQIGKYDVRRDAFIGKSGMAWTPMLRVSVATDEVFRTANAAGAAAVEARKLGRQRGVDPADVLNDPRVQKAAREAASRAVLESGGSIFGPMIGQAKEAFYSDNPIKAAAGLITHVLIPFSTVPDVLLFRPLRTLTAPGYLLAHLARGDRAAAAKDVGRIGFGGLVMGFLASEAIAGNITGGGPLNPQQKQALMEARDTNGDPVFVPNSVRIPDPTRPGKGHRWIQLQFFGTWAVPAIGVANAVEAYRYEGRKPDPQYVRAVGGKTAEAILDFSYLRQLGDFAKAIGEGRLPDILPQIAGNAASRLMPIGGNLAEFARGGDQYAKDYDPGLTGMAQRQAARIPFLSELVPDKIGAFGQPVERPRDVLSTLLPASAPGKVDPVAAEVGRLVAAGHPVALRTLGPRDEFAGSKQSPEQKRLIQQTMGKAAAAYLADLMSRSAYLALDDKGKAATLNKALGTAYELANRSLPASIARAPKHQALMAWAAVPQYQGISSGATPSDIRQQNYEVAQAHALLTDYQQRYGKDRGEYELYRVEPAAWKLAQRKRLDSDWLRSRRSQVDAAFGGVLEQDAGGGSGLLGAGNTIVPQAVPASAR